MNFFELGKEMQTLMSAAATVNRSLTAAASEVTGESPVIALATNFPCVPSPVFDDFDNNSFRTSLHAFTLISNTARGDDFVVATVSSQEVFDLNGRSFGNNIYLVRNPLQSMVELADALNESLGQLAGAVDLLYGMYNYTRGPNPPGLIPIIFGVRAQWTPNAGDFNNAGAGLLISLAARLVLTNNSCSLQIRAKSQESFGGPVTEFRAGPAFTQEKLNALATAYYRARVRRKGFQELNLNGEILIRMQLQE